MKRILGAIIGLVLTLGLSAQDQSDIQKQYDSFEIKTLSVASAASPNHFLLIDSLRYKTILNSLLPDGYEKSDMFDECRDIKCDLIKSEGLELL